MLRLAINDSHPFHIWWFRVAEATVALARLQPGDDLFSVKLFGYWLGLEDLCLLTTVGQDHNQAPSGDVIWRFVSSEHIPLRLKIADVVDVSQIRGDMDSVSEILDHLALNPTLTFEKILYPGSVQLAAEHTGFVGVGVQLDIIPTYF